MSNVFDAFDAREARVSLEKIREVLLIGLASYGELERLSDAQQIAKLCSNEIPEDLRVKHPARSPDTVSEFAEALIYVDLVMHQIRDWTAAGQLQAPEKTSTEKG
jgi:hypothetical protein